MLVDVDRTRSGYDSAKTEAAVVLTCLYLVLYGNNVLVYVL